VELHLDQIDQRAAASEDPRTLEQRLVLDDLEVEILREGVHEILVGYGWRKSWLRSDTLHGGREHGLQALALLP
jgi:hypothetical protein